MNVAERYAQLALTYPNHPNPLVLAIQQRLHEAHETTSTLLGPAFHHPAGSEKRAAALQAWAEVFEQAVDTIAHDVVASDRESKLPTHQQVMDEAGQIEWVVVVDSEKVRMRNSRLYGRRIILRRITRGNPVTFHDVTCERAGSNHDPLTTYPLGFILKDASRGRDWKTDMVNECPGWRIYA